MASSKAIQQKAADVVRENVVENRKLPEARITGQFRLYDLPDGGIHIAWIPDNADDSDTQHFELPGKILQMAKLASEGKLSIVEIAKTMMQGPI